MSAYPRACPGLPLRMSTRLCSPPHTHRRRAPPLSRSGSTREPTSMREVDVLNKSPLRIHRWILSDDSRTHRCVDLHLFRQPPPSASASPLRPGHHPAPLRGTVVLPILPGVRGGFRFGLSIMTLSNTRYTPNEPYSVLSWPVLQAQGFTKHEVTNHGRREGHHHSRTSMIRQAIERDLTGSARPSERLGSGRRSTDLSARTRPEASAGTRAARGRARLPPARTARPRPRPTRQTFVIRHPNIPGVDLLRCEYDEVVSPHTFVVRLTTGAADLEVDVREWAAGVRAGVLGAAADMPEEAWVGWFEPGRNDDNGDSAFVRAIRRAVKGRRQQQQQQQQR